MLFNSKHILLCIICNLFSISGYTQNSRELHDPFSDPPGIEKPENQRDNNDKRTPVIPPISITSPPKGIPLINESERKLQKAKKAILKGLQEDMVTIEGEMAEEGKQKQEVIDYHFEISPYEVTVGQFALFVEETGYTPSADRLGYSRIRSSDNPNHLVPQDGITWRCNPEGRPYTRKDYNHPVVHVSYRDAVAFCKWLSKKKDSLYEYHLPTQAQWIFAAKGRNVTNKYTWGSKEEDVVLNANIKGEKDGYEWCSPVGSYAPNAYGLYDMIGNVAEWCTDIDTSFEKERRIHKGGSYTTSLENCSISKTGNFTAELTHPGIGFRVYRTVRYGYDSEE